MKKDGLKRMLEFLDILRAKGIHFRIERQSPEALMVTFSHLDACVEVDFFVDEMWFSQFKRSGPDRGDESALRQLIEDNWGE
jgi:hypothetical protein